MSSGGAVQLVDIAQCPTPESLAEAIKGAMQTNGFLFILNHGLEKQAEEMFAISEEFFGQETAEEKLRCAYANNRGYTRVSQEVLDPTQPAPDLKEGFNTGYIAPGSPPVPSHPLPARMAKHTEALCQFQHDCFDFCQRLLEAFAIILDLDRNFFKANHVHDESDVSILRFLHYPEVPPGVQVSPNRAGAHSDYGSLTLLFQRSNGGEGLQILPSTEPLDSKNWKDTGVVDNALLVNIGDALELWSGAIFKSTLHRVVLPTPLPAEGIPERFSMAWFNQPKPSASLLTVVPTSQITEHDLARMERKGAKPGVDITASEHLLARLASTYKQLPQNAEA
ncbi:hypothetical protein BCR35DRAFT_289460 [Leucosporidium creatinivorum]|uniref:Fe2OG dioxygenase domain-containing protein n=1 Tax=Leucosporidium creatinivorum TaxID=106004 RepID=A0A1Y2FTY4_9BASI|nr:hypothetical protein BCR35DRAFT_289460 [Leucosporidium creatinivorum]